MQHSEACVTGGPMCEDCGVLDVFLGTVWDAVRLFKLSGNNPVDVTDHPMWRDLDPKLREEFGSMAITMGVTEILGQVTSHINGHVMESIQERN